MPLGIQTTQEIRANQGNTWQKTLGTTPYLASANAPKRSSFEVVNLGIDKIYYAYTRAKCTINDGFPIFSNGYKSWIKTRLDIWLVGHNSNDVRCAEEKDGI